MFDFAWSELGLIAAVALILIGPKDMPVAIRTITDMIKKARRMASEFQGHVDEMMREADLGEVREHIDTLRNFDVRGALERHIDPDHALRDTFSDNPLEPGSAQDLIAEPAPVDPVAVAELEPITLAAPAPAAAAAAPAFVPPGYLPPQAKTDDADEAPAFIPPPVVLQRRSRPTAQIDR